MDEFIHVEPGHPHRPAFAAWGLTQDPPLQTASASGWDVPLDLYPQIPEALLEGAFVDGFLYGHRRIQPKLTEDAVDAADVPSATPVEPSALDAIIPKTSTRRRKSSSDK